MKKALSAAMAAGMTAVMLAGCGSSASSAAESTAPAREHLCRRLPPKLLRKASSPPPLPLSFALCRR